MAALSQPMLLAKRNARPDIACMERKITEAKQRVNSRMNATLLNVVLEL